VQLSRFYLYLTSIYRFGIIALVIALDVLTGFDYELHKLMIYALFILYGIVFAVFRVNKWIAYTELLGIIILLTFINEPVLNYLFMIPFLNFISSDAKKMDVLLFWLVSVCYIYFATESLEQQLITTIALSIGLLAALYMLHQKFYHIEKLSNELFKSKEEIKEYRNEITTQEQGLEITMKMFYHMRELSEAKNEEEVISKMLFGSKAFFNAMYACLYTKEEGYEHYEKTQEEGDSSRFEVADTLEDLPENKEAFFDNQMMRTPIVVNGEDWGVIVIYGKRMAIGEKGQMVLSPFNESDFETMLTYIYSVTKRITEMQISHQNLFLANNDFLTKVPNRRYFWEQLDRMIDLGQRGDEFGVLIIDIDNFKNFNDTYGHDMGDSVLKIVAETIANAVRKADIVGRIGGEEFAVILYKPKSEGMMVADRIRKMVATVPGPPRQITLSIGLAYFGKHGVTVEEIMKNADAAMYKAKTTGKNKVVEYAYGMGMERH